jgi:hypothetical protein
VAEQTEKFECVVLFTNRRSAVLLATVILGKGFMENLYEKLDKNDRIGWFFICQRLKIVTFKSMRL